MKIKIVVHEAEEGGYWAEVPAIPGCATQGDSMEELMQNLREAIEVPVALRSEIRRRIEGARLRDAETARDLFAEGRLRSRERPLRRVRVAQRALERFPPDAERAHHAESGDRVLHAAFPTGGGSTPVRAKTK